MAIIKIDDYINREDKQIRKFINELIVDTQDQADNLKAIIIESPQILKGYDNFRTILRAVKRGSTLSDAIKKYARESCPPRIDSDEECSEISCCLCWREYCLKYLEVISKDNAGDK